MTDKNIADATYLEPINIKMPCRKSLLKRKNQMPFLPTVGGQTALDMTMTVIIKKEFLKNIILN